MTQFNVLAQWTLLLYILHKLTRKVLIPFFNRSPFRDLPGPARESWFKGNLGQLFNAKGLPFHLDIAERYGGVAKVYGFFGDEQLYVSDPIALQSIIVKDQDAFEETAVFTECNRVIFGPGLVATTGEQHKRQRKIINPLFSISQLRRLAPVMYKVASKLAGVLEKQVNTTATATNDAPTRRVSDSAGILDMSEWMSRVALELVGQTVLGYSFDPLDTAHNNAYTSAVKELIPTLFRLAIVRQFAPFLVSLGPAWFRRRLVEWTPNAAVQKVKDMSDVMHQTAQDILRQKKEELAERADDNNFTTDGSKDVISLLLRENERAIEGKKLSEDELTGQMTVLIFGAQDTTSSSLSRILFMLSRHPEIQSRVRDEIRAALRQKPSNNTPSVDEGESCDWLRYEEVTALPILDAVIKETLRLYPPVPFVRRTAVKERTIPYTDPTDPSGLSTQYITIPVGTTLFVGIASSNRLESVWGPDAKEWKPERWLSDSLGESSPGMTPPTESSHHRTESHTPPARLPGIYSGMMSFLGGGRACIGWKFAQVEMKILLSVLLSRFEFAATEDKIVWNLSQIISPSVQRTRATNKGYVVEESKGLPLVVRPINSKVIE